MKTFVEDVLAKEVELSDIDSYVSDWHNNSDITCTLQEYLGFTEKEYKEWLQCGDESTLARIIEAHRDKL